jgi:hypothetical protein
MPGWSVAPVGRPSRLLARVGFDISRDGKLLMVQEVKTDEQRTAALALVQKLVQKLACWRAEVAGAAGSQSGPRRRRRSSFYF